MADGDSFKRPQFGNRFLEDPGKVFEHNAWDNVQWDATQEEEARAKVEKNSKTPVCVEMQEKYEVEADHYWDEFYTQHQNRFFKDRHWLFTEFPELAPLDDRASVHPRQSGAEGQPATVSEDRKPAEGPNNTDAAISSGKSSEQVSSSHLTDTVSSSHQSNTDRSSDQKTAESYPGESSKMRIFEVGCGVGNTVFPVLQTNNDTGLFVYCCDLSSTAIQLVKDHPDYTSERCHAFVCNVADPECNVPFPDESLDIVILIFVLSAIHPEKFQSTINRLVKFLKPGGRILLRDYGRYDLAQLRFKDGRCLSDNFYVRGDGTRVYFFTQEELREFFTKAGLCEEQNLVDRRLQVNRGRQLKMYRVWIQCKYQKPHQTDTR